jgi:hypothetical protein
MKYFFLFFISILFYSCHSKSTIQDNTQKIIASNKTFMRQFSFSGEISKKLYCQKCQINKYQITVIIKSMSPNNIPLSNQSFQPYYFFNSNTKLNISVSKGLYDYAQENQSIEKEMNSSNLIIGGQPHKFINEEKYKWIPN